MKTREPANQRQNNLMKLPSEQMKLVGKREKENILSMVTQIRETIQYAFIYFGY